MLVEHSLNLLAITLLELTAATGRLEDVPDSEASLHLSVVFLHFEHRLPAFSRHMSLSLEHVELRIAGQLVLLELAHQLLKQCQLEVRL